MKLNIRRLRPGRRGLLVLGAVVVAFYALGIVVDINSPRLLTDCAGARLGADQQLQTISEYREYVNVRLRSVAFDTQFVQFLHEKKTWNTFLARSDSHAESFRSDVVYEDWTVTGLVHPAWQPPEDIGLLECTKRQGI
jgi:hypothetical protein